MNCDLWCSHSRIFACWS